MNTQISSQRIVRTESRPVVRAAETHTWWGHLLWIGAAAVLGFLVSALFAGVLGLPRRLFLVPHVLLSGGLVVAYWRWSHLDVAELLRRRWVWGLVGGVLVGAFLVTNVLSQPASPRSTGLTLLFDLVWLGVIYGTVDALLLSVLPIVATWRAFALVGWTQSRIGWVGIGVLAFLFSLAVTIAYHAGYPEFQGPEMVGPVIGNGASSLGYLLTGNPLGSLISHIAMHIASVFHGPETTIQLPPHY